MMNPNFKQRLLLSFGVVAVVAAGIIFAVRSGSADTSDNQSNALLAVETQLLIKQTSYESTARYPGKVRAPRRSQLGFERGGLLASVAIQDGENVTKGAVLARLDQRALKADLAAAKASLSAAKAARDDAKASLALAKATTDRQRYLLEKGHISQQRYDDANFGAQSAAARVTTAEAQIRVAKAQLETVKVALSLSDLIAPFDGIAVRRLADEGTVLAPGTPVFDFEESGMREFVTGVPADVVGGIAVGSDMDIRLSGSTVRATLQQKVASLDGATRTAQLVFNLPATSPALSGQVGELILAAKHDTAGFWVPLEALQEGQRGLWSVFVATRKEGESTAAQLVRHPVELLYAELGRAYVRGSLTDGEQLIVSGLNRLIAGQTVRLAPSATGR